MKYKVGDRVRIVKKWNKDTCESSAGGMDKWLGKVMTIREFVGGFATMEVYRMVEDCHEHAGDGFLWNDACIEGLANEKIVITTDGTETLARLYDGKKVVKSASAKCSPSDKFDFNTGVKIAVDRLLGENKPDEKKPDEKKTVLEVGKYYKVNAPVLLSDLNGIIKITKKYTKDGEDRFAYKVVEGMKGDNKDKTFAAKSNFALALTPIDYTEKTKYNGKVVCTKSVFGFWTVGKVYEFKDGVIRDDYGDARGEREPYTSFEDFKRRFIVCWAHEIGFIPLVEG